MLFEIVAGAVGGNPLLGSAAEQLVDGHAERVAHQIPHGKVDPADGVDGNAVTAVRHAGAPKDIPVALDIEGIFSEEQFGKVLCHNLTAPRAPCSVAFDAF